ncbi:MAG: NADH-quinone oxidoreductase subunit, partial [Candidatus Hydrogenedentes bacterium]|nr:NADH-quinone oxidoreductase subunit [Candidatus Hydrogenedentota bacterium]
MDKLLLTLIAFLPMAGGAAILLTPSKRPDWIRAIAVLTSGIVFLLTLYLWHIFDASAIKAGAAYSAYDARTLVETAWIAPYHIYYRVGVDGLSVMLIALTGL